MKKDVICPWCGKSWQEYANPKPTVDVIIYDQQKGVVIIKRRNFPHGYALPGGFVDEGESVEHAAIREMKEETGLDVKLTGLLGVYSRPDRDPRQHTISTVFIGEPVDPVALKAGDDAAEAVFYPLDKLPEPIVFDHLDVLNDFKKVISNERSAASITPDNN